MQCEICKKINLPLTRENNKWVCVKYCLSYEKKKMFSENNIIGNIEIK